MSLDEWVQPTVHPEVRAHVNSLVSALGGSSAEYDGRYVLGDDALACLKDIKRWIRLYDEGYNRHDVARALAEADLVNNDLLEILSSWPETDEGQGLRYKIAASCLELLVPLTWPIEKDDTKMTVHNHKHLPYLQLAQVKYKRAILQHDSERILRTIVRVGLPAMAEPRNERAPRDEGIIKLVLFALRNVAMIEQPRNLPVDGDESDISRSALIDAFQKQDIFQLLLTIGSSIGDEFDTQDVLMLEILFHLLKGIDPEKLFMEEKRLATANTHELRGLIQKEKAMLSGYARNAPSRHNRFGTMIWVKRGDDRVSTVSGQDFLGNDQRSLIHMDKSKKWNKPKHRGKREEDAPVEDFDISTPLSQRARKQLRSFVEEFLDSSFNPLFGHLRKAIEREAERVMATNWMQYFYLISWFLKAECARRKLSKDKKGSRTATQANDAEEESFALVASVLTQGTFILLNRFMQRSQDDKAWNDLNAGMKCFTQILLTIQEMSESPLKDDQDIAENIENRIFYEETTHERVLTILRSYKDQGFGYLDACTELAHVFLRMLERYSKQNVDLQIRSRRRARKKQKAAEGVEDQGVGQEEEQTDLHEAQRTVSERKFDFHRFAAKFTTQPCINTFVALTRYYNDLSTEQLKRAHRYLHRVAFKMELATILYRVDILQLLFKMIKGPGGLDQDSPCFKEWEELIRHLFRQAIKKIQERPELITEMLFSKINSTMFYLEHGYDKEVIKRAPRAPAELEVKPGASDPIGLVVHILTLQAKFGHLNWLQSVLESAAEERKAWEDAHQSREAAQETIEQPGEGAENAEEPRPSTDGNKEIAPSIFVKPDDDEIKAAMFKDNKLRLLMTLVGFMRLGTDEDPEASWIIPSNVSSETLESMKWKVEHAVNEGGPEIEEGKSAEDYLRRKRKVDYDDDTEGSSGDEDFLFPAGGPTARKSDEQDGSDEAPKRRRRLKRRDAEQELDDEEEDRRRKAREEAQKEKLRKIKSNLYVDSDDEEDDEEKDKEFFAREEQLRKNTREHIMKALSEAEVNSKPSKKRKSTGADKGNRKKSKVASEDEEDVSANDTEEDDDLIETRVARRSSPAEITLEDEDNDSEMTDTPLSSPHADAPATERPSKIGEVMPLRTTLALDKQNSVFDEDSDEDLPVRTQRRNVRGGFVIDSDSE